MPVDARENPPIPTKPVESARTNGPAEGIRGDSTGLGADLAHALRLAADAGQWSVVSALVRQLDLLNSQRGANALRIVRGGQR